MVSTREPLAIYQIARNLLECVEERIAQTPSGAPARSCVISGAIAWDDCECDGQLIVSIGSSFFSSNFPAIGNVAPVTGGSGRCGPPILVVEYTVSMLRCAPGGGDDPEPPTCEELDESAQVTERDAHAVLWGAHCCLKAWSKTGADPAVKIHDFIITSQDRVGPDGGCVGTDTNIQVGIVNACPPCDETGS